MEHRFFFASLIFALVLKDSFVSALPEPENRKLDDRLNAVWSGVWNLACNLPPIQAHSRAKRSAPLNTRNPKEVFQYLYPLAKVKNAAEILQPPNGPPENSARSFFTTPPSQFVAFWIDDIIGAFGSECKPRNLRKRFQRKSRSHVRFQGSPPENPSTPHHLSSWRSCLHSPGPWSNSEQIPEQLVSKRRGYNSPASLVQYNGTTGNGYDVDEDESAESLSEDQQEDEDDGDDDEDDEETLDDQIAETTTPAVTTTSTTSTTAGPDDPHFASYGGDIEYVFPIVSFNVPFDGQITVVGFHGFDGLYNTYK